MALVPRLSLLVQLYAALQIKYNPVQGVFYLISAVLYEQTYNTLFGSKQLNFNQNNPKHPFLKNYNLNL